MRVTKHQKLDLHDIEKREGLDKFERKDKGENIGYVPFAFVLPPQKKSNHLTDMG